LELGSKRRNNKFNSILNAVKIRVERSGGVTGVPLLNELDAKNLPSTLLATAKKVIKNKKLSSLPMRGTPKGSADLYCYKISIQDGVNRRVIECNEYTIQNDLRLLVEYIERNSKKQ
jgi:hypothetical protein